MEIGINDLASGIDTVWVLLCAALVFLMEGGFAFLEAGFIRAKNSMNIVMTEHGALSQSAFSPRMADCFTAAVPACLRYRPSACFRYPCWPLRQLILFSVC